MKRLAWALADSRARALVTRAALPGGLPPTVPVVDLDGRLRGLYEKCVTGR